MDAAKLENDIMELVAKATETMSLAEIDGVVGLVATGVEMMPDEERADAEDES